MRVSQNDKRLWLSETKWQIAEADQNHLKRQEQLLMWHMQCRVSLPAQFRDEASINLSRVNESQKK